MVQMLEQKSRPTVKQRVTKLNESMQGSQAWNSIFRPGSILEKVIQTHHEIVRMWL